MSDTPRTDNAIHDEHDPYEAVGTLCHKLERELNAANTQIGLLVSGSKQQERQIEFLKGRVKELEHDLLSLVFPICEHLHHPKKHKHKYQE